MARISRDRWDKARAKYRRGEASLREIAKELGAALSTVSRRATKEKWFVERAQVADAAQTKAREKDIESLAAMLARHKRLAALGLTLAGKKLEAAAEMAEMSPDAFSSDGLDIITKVVARMVPVERLASGIERIKPVKPVEIADDDEIIFEIDAPTEAVEAAPAAAPAKT